MELENLSLSTSGAYERYFKKDGKVFHHIIDPKTGYPSNSGLLSISIIAKQSVDSDAFSKLFILKEEKCLEILSQTPDLEAVLVTNDKRVILTHGMISRFHLMENSGYTLSLT